MIRLLIVDDHFFVRAGLRGSLDGESDIEICGEASSASKAVEAYHELKPDLMLLDLLMPDGDGVEVLQKLRSDGDSPVAIIFSVEENETCISRAVAAGAAGYLPKSVSRAVLLKAIRCVVAGGTFYPPEVMAKLKESRCRTPLSPRELEILRLIVDGQPNKLISCILGISENTVKLHITHLLSKTGAPDRTSVVKMAIQRGWVRI
jgi:DNA-binding NarL/FixJ family response regulator